MALAATIVLEVNVLGDDTNGGGYDSTAGTIDFSIQPSPAVAVVDAATNGSTSITTSAGTFSSQMVGNLLYIAGGTGSIAADWYQVATFVSIGEITVDRATGLSAGTGATLNLGGALKTYGAAGLIIENHGLSGMIVFIRRNATPFDITDANDNVSGGVINFTSTTNSYTLVGYDTTRTVDNTDANRPTIRCVGVDPAAMLDMNNTNDAQTQYATNLILDINGRDCLSGFMVRGSGISWAETIVRRVTAIGDNVASLTCFSACRAVECLADNAGADGFELCACTTCYSTSSGVLGYDRCQAVQSAANGDAIGFQNLGVTTGVIVGCLAYKCTSHGFVGDANDGVLMVDCVSVGNGGKGFDKATGAKLVLINCASGTNSSGRGDPTLDIGAVILPNLGDAADYFTDAASGDFRPAVTGDAALLNAAATYVQSSTLNATRDIGAVQHADPAGGGMLVHPGTAGGARG